jgi:hypothetical protein
MQSLVTLLGYGFPVLFLLALKMIDGAKLLKVRKNHKRGILFSMIGNALLLTYNALISLGLYIFGLGLALMIGDIRLILILPFLIPVLLLWLSSIYEIVVATIEKGIRKYIWLTVLINHGLCIAFVCLYFSILFPVYRGVEYTPFDEDHSIFSLSHYGERVATLFALALLVIAVLVAVKLILNRLLAKKLLKPIEQPESTVPSAPSDGEGADGATEASADLPPSALS